MEVEGRVVCRDIMQHDELVVQAGDVLPQALLRCGCLLNRMRPAFAARTKLALTLVSDGIPGHIDSDDRNANRAAACPPELCNLILKGRNHAVDLLDHGFEQYLDLNPDLDGGDSAA
jgi:hypothetical protein